MRPFDRRDLFAGAGGLFVCTLAGQKVVFDREADVEGLAGELDVPPKVAAAEASGAGYPQAQTVLAAATGVRREYWIRAEPVRWNIVPTKRDGMMDKKI